MQFATRKPIFEHCCSFVVAMGILWVLARYRDAYPFNCLLLFVWILALLASVPPACLIILTYQGAPDMLSHQGGPEFFAEDVFPISMNDLSREKLVEMLKYCWPNCLSVRDKLMDHRPVIARAAILALSLSISSVFIELQFNLSNSDLSSSVTMLRSALSCWWTYSLLCGLRFGGFAVTECQHRLANIERNCLKKK
jgi:hypothetical protein